MPQLADGARTFWQCLQLLRNVAGSKWEAFLRVLHQQTIILRSLYCQTIIFLPLNHEPDPCKYSFSQFCQLVKAVALEDQKAIDCQH